MNAFATLYGRLLRLDLPAPVPLAPPALPFVGDVVSTSVAGTPTGVEFIATGPKAPGVVTELLIEPLASRNRRTYRERYRHPAFVACAYQFVNSATGQATEIAELGVVRVV